MATRSQFRTLALALPATEEKSHFGQPDFRVANKIFADLSREGERATLKLTHESQATLLEIRPDVFSMAPGHWGKSGWTYVELKAIQVAELKELLNEAWQLVAPRRLHASAKASTKKRRPRA